LFSFSQILAQKQAAKSFSVHRRWDKLFDIQCSIRNLMELTFVSKREKSRMRGVEFVPAASLNQIETLFRAKIGLETFDCFGLRRFAKLLRVVPLAPEMQTKWEISFPVGVTGINLYSLVNINHT